MSLADVAVEHDGHVPIAVITGEVDMSNASELALAMQRAVEQKAAGLVIDLAGTSYLDSAGLHFIFDLGKRLRDRGQRLVLVVPEDSALNRLLTLVKVDSLAPMERTRDAAVERLKAHEESQ